MSEWGDLPEELRSAASKFATPEDALRAYVNLEKFRGNSVRLPETDADHEDLYRKLGAPENKDGYEGDDATKALARDLRLTPDQFKRLTQRKSIETSRWNEFVENMGENYDSAAANAKAGAEKMGLSELPQDPKMFEALVEIGKMNSNDQTPTPGSGAGPTDSQRRQQRKMEILAHPQFTDRRFKNTPEGMQLHAEYDQILKEELGM